MPEGTYEISLQDDCELQLQDICRPSVGVCQAIIPFHRWTFLDVSMACCSSLSACRIIPLTPHLLLEEKLHLDDVQAVFMRGHVPESSAAIFDADAQLVGAGWQIPGVVCLLSRTDGLPVVPCCVPLLEQHIQTLTPA